MPPRFVEGQTATNPQTGQRIVWQRGRWYPVGANGQAQGAAPARPGGRRSARDEMAINEAREQANGAMQQLPQLQRFRDLNARQGTGGAMNLPGIGVAARVLGRLDPEIQQMEAITANLAPQQRIPGSGTTSDRDLALFMQSVPGITQSRETNNALTEQGMVEAHRRRARSAWLERWAQTRNNLDGAQAAFDRWWHQQMQERTSPRAAGQAQAAPNRPVSEMSDEEVLRAAGIR